MQLFYCHHERVLCENVSPSTETFQEEKIREAYNQHLTLQDELGSDRGPRHRTCSASLAFYKNYELFSINNNLFGDMDSEK
jgi:hypothetical protein